MAQKKSMSFFDRYLTIWVALGILAGVVLGHYAGNGIEALSNLQIARVNIPIAVLIWLMIYPMMLQIDFTSIKKVGKKTQRSNHDGNCQLVN